MRWGVSKTIDWHLGLSRRSPFIWPHTHTHTRTRLADFWERRRPSLIEFVMAWCHVTCGHLVTCPYDFRSDRAHCTPVWACVSGGDSAPSICQRCGLWIISRCDHILQYCAFVTWRLSLSVALSVLIALSFYSPVEDMEDKLFTNVLNNHLHVL